MAAGRGDRSTGGLSAKQRAVMATLAQALFPRGGALEPGAEDIDLAQQFEALVASLDPPVRRLIQRFITALDLSSLFSPHLRSFHRLAPEAREAYLHACQNDRFRRKLLLVLQFFCDAVYCSDERIRRLIGYEAPLFQVQEERPISPLPCLAYPELDQHWEDEADVVVVGSGAGGATVAAELAEAGLSVVIVEEGGQATREDFRAPLLTRALRFYRDNGLTYSLGTPIIHLPMGQVVGGTTVVNSGTCFRPPPSVLHRWGKEYGVQGVEPEQMAPIFDRIEANLNVTPVMPEIMGHNGAILRRGAEVLGVSHGAIRRPTRGCQGTFSCVFGCPRDAKLDMRLTYLPKAIAAGTRLYARCRVERILTERGRAVGVQAAVLSDAKRATGYRLTVFARAVVPPAGALYTPWLLLRNRLGNSTGQVGLEKRLHPGCGVAGALRQIRGWQGVLPSYSVEEGLEEGFLLEATFPPPGVGYSAGMFPFVGREHKELLAHYDQMAAVGILISDTSTGRVRLAPGGRPFVLYNLGWEDTRRVLRAIEMAARLYFAAGAREVYPGLPGLEVLRSESEISYLTSLRWQPGDLRLASYHPQGTCRMGEDPLGYPACQWVWGHCKAFREDETVAFEGLSARLRLGPFRAPARTLFCLRLQDRLYWLNGVRQLWTFLKARRRWAVGVLSGRGQGSAWWGKGLSLSPTC